jgi:uncharacterized glyoxalase superfamily protein PhnB
MSDAPIPSPPGPTPHLCVRDGAAAIAFYERAFGARTEGRMPSEDGKRILFASLAVNGQHLYLSDHFPEYGMDTAPPEGPPPLTIHLQVDDAHAWFRRAVEAGATPLMPPEPMFWGDTYGRLRDPFGFVWSVAHPTR